MTARSFAQRGLKAMKNKRPIFDVLLISAIFLIAGAAFLCLKFSGRAGDRVEIRVGGELFATLPLGEDREIDVNGLCVVKIENGSARVESAVCKNQICVHHRPISRQNETIVCLPGGVTVKVAGSGGVDLISG